MRGLPVFTPWNAYIKKESAQVKNRLLVRIPLSRKSSVGVHTAPHDNKKQLPLVQDGCHNFFA
jgi:hypothetical protein